MIASHANTIVATFQVGRVYDGGSCDIGWATSTDGGRTWQTGLLPLTIYGGQATTDAGPLTRASDPSVAYDAEDGIWLINTLGLAGDAEVPGIFVNRSSDGLTWGPPIATHVAVGNDSPDKNWITCDNWPSSAGYGNCYEEYDNSAEGGRIKMQTSTDGSLTWSPPANLANQAGGIGGVPLVQPPPPGAPPGSVCGRVVVPIALNGMSWYTSTNCGASWSAPTQITPNMTAEHFVAGGLRTSLLPASAMDGAGAIYAVWQTRSFRTQNTTLAAAPAAGATCVRLVSISGLAPGQTLRIDPNGAHPEVVTIVTVGSTACNGASGATITPALAYAHPAGALVMKNNVASNLSSDPNDIAPSVMPAPTDGNPTPSFGGPVRIPIEADSGGSSNTNDHFIPGIGADPNTSGSTAHLGLFYYSYRVANCQGYNADNLCRPRVGYVSSIDGGAHWTAPTYLASMTLAEIARMSQGPMVGDYATADVIPAGPVPGEGDRVVRGRPRARAGRQRTGRGDVHADVRAPDRHYPVDAAGDQAAHRPAPCDSYTRVPDCTLTPRPVAVPEIPLRETKFGLVADGDGWFVINARESRWRDAGHFGLFCNFEGKRRFRQLGINLNVLEPGQPIGLYHRERAQEDFLVLSGECLLLVEGQERRLRAWDFVHCPAETNHMILGVGSGPAVVLAVGARGGRKGLVYPVDPLALAHGAGVEQEATKPEEAYAPFPAWTRRRYREGSLPDYSSA